jgi:hypothetical protein
LGGFLALVERLFNWIGLAFGSVRVKIRCDLSARIPLPGNCNAADKLDLNDDNILSTLLCLPYRKFGISVSRETVDI